MPAQSAKNVALTPQLETFVDELVASGEYKSASEVVRDGLRALKERRERHQIELDQIQNRIGGALDSLDRGTHAEGSMEEVLVRALDRAKLGVRKAS